MGQAGSLRESEQSVGALFPASHQEQQESLLEMPADSAPANEEVQGRKNCVSPIIRDQVLCKVGKIPFVSYSLPPRFLLRIDFKADGCWLWTGGVRHKKWGGYPAYNVETDNPRNIAAAHRFSYVAHKGPIPPGLEIDHVCCNKLCVNPEHLQAVTHAENMRLWSIRRRKGVRP